MGMSAYSLNELVHEYDNFIEQARLACHSLTYYQSLQKAELHLWDVLKCAPPQIYLGTNYHSYLQIIHYVLNVRLWKTLLLISAYVYMYMVIIDRYNPVIKILVYSFLLLLFFVDISLYQHYRRSEDAYHAESKISFYLRVVLLVLMALDLILFCILLDSNRPIRPFRIFRALLPVSYDSEMRHSFQALFSAYKDIVVYFCFYAAVFFLFGLVGSQLIDVPTYYYHDPYTQDYKSLYHMILIMYVSGTYDSYPDNYLAAVRISYTYYAFFILFVFLNLFIFSSVPGSLIYHTYRLCRSRLIGAADLARQHSIILVYIALYHVYKKRKIRERQENNCYVGENCYVVENCIPTELFLEFLLKLYRNDSQRMNQLTELCLSLGHIRKKYITLPVFMELGRLLANHPELQPSYFEDWQVWVNFRSFLNHHLHLRSIVTHWLFDPLIAILILVSVINAWYYMYNYNLVFGVLDTFFVFFFVLEIFAKVVALGPTYYFSDQWNCTDFAIVSLNLLFFLVVNSSSHGDGVVRVMRIFRLSSLVRIVTHNRYCRYELDIYSKFKLLIDSLLVILPMILKFIPLILITWFVFGVIGMEIFYNDIFLTKTQYSTYDYFSNFATFINTQYIMMQILTEAGWSLIAYDHAARHKDYFFVVMLYFIVAHICIVLVLATLLKGLLWEVYFAIYNIHKANIVKTQLELYEDDVSGCDSLAYFPQISDYSYLNYRLNIHTEPIVDNGYTLYLQTKLVVYDSLFNVSLTEIYDLLDIELGYKEVCYRLLRMLYRTGDTTYYGQHWNKHAQRIDAEGVIRSVYLNQTSLYYTRRQYYQYFRLSCGKSFKNLCPPNFKYQLSVQATLLYALRQLLKCRYLSGEFFRSMTRIYRDIGYKLLGGGSVFKFVFRVNWSWLEISYHSGMLCVSPLPNSYWLVYPGMKKNVLYVAHDLFKASANTKKTDRNYQHLKNNLTCLASNIRTVSRGKLTIKYLLQSSHTYDVYSSMHDNHYYYRKQEIDVVNMVMILAIVQAEEIVDESSSEYNYFVLTNSNEDKKENYIVQGQALSSGYIADFMYEVGNIVVGGIELLTSQASYAVRMKNISIDNNRVTL